MITGESVKIGTVIELLKIFPGVEVYKEEVTIPKYPHFFVNQLSLTPPKLMRNRWELQYLMNIRYRHAADISTVLNIQQILDNVILKLSSDLIRIDIDGTPIRISNKRGEKPDKILQYFFNVNFHVTTEEMETIKMDKILIQGIY